MAAAFNYEDWYDIKAGDRIAQLAIRQVPDVRWEEVARLPSSERGQGGFGSSGV
jgi:dUTP pyrophosphatase